MVKAVDKWSRSCGSKAGNLVAGGVLAASLSMVLAGLFVL